MSAISQGRAAGAGHGATIVAAACSAALHGALAAGVFLWPIGPVPYSAGNPIVVELIATTQKEAVGVVAASTGSASPDDTPTTDSEVALSVQSGSSDTELTEGAAVAPAPSRLRPEPVATIPVVPPRPARRPAAPPIEHTDSAPGDLETPTASDTTTDGPVVALPGGDFPSSQTNAGSDAPSAGEVAAAPQVGPHFAIGSAGNPLPRYPTAARRRSLEGRVVLRVFVAADGHAQSVSVRSGSSHAILDEAAVETLRRWRFEPARRAGVPVAAWVDVPITFQLRD